MTLHSLEVLLAAILGGGGGRLILYLLDYSGTTCTYVNILFAFYDEIVRDSGKVYPKRARFSLKPVSTSQ